MSVDVQDEPYTQSIPGWEDVSQEAPETDHDPGPMPEPSPAARKGAAKKAAPKKAAPKKAPAPAPKKAAARKGVSPAPAPEPKKVAARKAAEPASDPSSTRKVPAPSPMPAPTQDRFGAVVSPADGRTLKIPVVAKAHDWQILVAMRKPAQQMKNIADSTRAAIILLLAENGEMSVNEICAALGYVSQPGVSHHLAILRHTDVITSCRSAKNIYYDLSDIGNDLARVLKGLTG